MIDLKSFEVVGCILVATQFILQIEIRFWFWPKFTEPIWIFEFCLGHIMIFLFAVSGIDKKDADSEIDR